MRGYPAPAYVIRIPVRFSDPPPKYDSIPRAPPLPRVSSSSWWSDSSPAFFHRLYLLLWFALEEVVPAVPKMLRHSMSVLSGTSNAALSRSWESWDDEGGFSERYEYSSKISEKINAVPIEARFERKGSDQRVSSLT